MIKNCAQCGCEFNAHQQRNKFCSNKCKAKSYLTVTNKCCPACGKSFKPVKHDTVCCSRACSGSMQSTKIEKLCPICLSKFKRRLRQDTIYCSRKCYGISKTYSLKEILSYVHNIPCNLDSSWSDEHIEDIFNLSNIDIDEQLNAKSYVGSLKRRY